MNHLYIISSVVLHQCNSDVVSDSALSTELLLHINSQSRGCSQKSQVLVLIIMTLVQFAGLLVVGPFGVYCLAARTHVLLL